MPKLSDTIQNWLMQKRDRAYLNRLTGPQLDDLGLSRDEGLRLTASRADTRQRLLAMAARYGLHASDIDADRQAGLDIALACGRCEATRICGRYLSGKAQVEPDTFCPNAGRYEELATSSR